MTPPTNLLLGDRPPRSPGVDPKQLAAELQKVSQQQGPSSGSCTSLPAATSATSSPGQPGSPSIGKKRHSSKVSRGAHSLERFIQQRTGRTEHPRLQIYAWTFKHVALISCRLQRESRRHPTRSLGRSRSVCGVIQAEWVHNKINWL